MATFAQNTSDGDLSLASGRLAIVRDAAQEAAITLRNKFLRVKGEWFLDSEEGIPYFELVFLKNPNLPVVRRIFEKVILSVPAILEIQEFDLSIDVATRNLRFSFRALCEDGRVLVGGLGERFLIEVE